MRLALALVLLAGCHSRTDNSSDPEPTTRARTTDGGTPLPVELRCTTRFTRERPAVGCYRPEGTVEWLTVEVPAADD